MSEQLAVHTYDKTNITKHTLTINGATSIIVNAVANDLQLGLGGFT